MKILIVTGIFPPDAGGPASYVPAIAEALSRDHDIVGVVTLSDALDHDDSAYSFPVMRVLRNQNKLARRRQTVGLISRLAAEADVVYLNGLVLEGIVATRLLRRRPTVVKVVGDLVWEQARNQGATQLDIEGFQAPGAKPPRWTLLHRLQGLYTAAANRVIVPSAFLAGVVRGWGVPATKVDVVLNAVAPPEAPDSGAPVYDVVTVARLVSWKGIDALIDICAARGWSLLVVGDGPLRAELEARAAASGAKVEFSGNVPKARVADLIREARVFVLNSSYEGLPHIVLEAKLAGRPVVATAVGGTPETIHHGIDGYLAPVHDNQALSNILSKLLDDEPHRQAIAEAGRADAQKRFSFETMYADTVKVLTAARADG